MPVLETIFEAASSIIHRAENTIVAAVFSVANLLLMQEPIPFWKKLVEFFLSVSVATLVGFICEDLDVSRGISFACVAMAALLARSMLTFTLGLGDYMYQNRKRVYEALLQKLLGSKKLDKTKE